MSQQIEPGMTQSNHHPGHWAGWPCVLVLLVCLPALLMDLGGRDSTHTMENIALVTSQETWLRIHAGESDAWLMTTNDGHPRVEKPPLQAWWHFLAWIGLDPSTAQPTELLWRARVVAIGAGLLLLAAIYWLGNTLGGVRLAITATLIAGSTIFLQRQARTASYDIHYVAWSTLSVAAALWAMQIRRVHRADFDYARTIGGWLLAGIACAAAVMSKNPLPVVIVIIPLLIAICCLPMRRKPALLGLLSVVVITVLLVGNWYLYAVMDYEDAVRTLTNEFRMPYKTRHAPQSYYYINILALVLPWSLWLVSGLLHPFAPLLRGQRRQLLFPWLWFVAIFVLFSLFDAKQQRYILPIMPAAALLMGRVWSDHESYAQQKLKDRSTWILIWGHGFFCIVISLAISVLLMFQEGIINTLMSWQSSVYESLCAQGKTSGFLWDLVSGDDLPDQPVVGNIPWHMALCYSIVLIAMVVGGWWYHRRWQPIKACMIYAAWSLLFMAIWWHVYASAPSANNPCRAPAEFFAQECGHVQLYSLRVTEHERNKEILNEEFRFYFGKLILHITPEDLIMQSELAESPIYVLAKENPEHTAIMLQSEGEKVRLVQVDKDQWQQLWLVQ